MSGGTNQSATPAALLAAGEGQALWFLHDRMVLKATAATTNGAYGLLESHVPAGFSPPMHVHTREDETFWVLEGTVTFRCGDETFVGEPGAHVFLPRGIPHGFVVEGDVPARMLTLLTPGGGEGFFVEASRPAKGPGFPPPDPIDVPALQRAARKFGLELVGPPLRAAKPNSDPAPVHASATV